MSALLLIVPDGWTRISQEMIDAIGANQIVGWISTSDYTTLGIALAEQGYVGNLVEAVFFNSEILVVR